MIGASIGFPPIGLPRVKPLPKQPPRGARAMTIALGAFTGMGSIVAADSHEGYGYIGSPKFSVGKIDTFEEGITDEKGTRFSRSLILTGAGDSGYLASVKHKITEAFRWNRELTIPAFEIELENQIANFYERHIKPFPSQEGWGDLNISLIIAAQIGPDRRMWVTRMNDVRPVASGVAAVGVGDTWARTVLKGFFPIAADERCITILAVYAALMAKEHTEGCGMDTWIVYAPAGGSLKYIRPDAVEKMEKCFRLYERIERNERMRAMGMRIGLPDPDSMDGLLLWMRDELAGIDLYGDLTDWIKPQEGGPPNG